MFGTKPQLEQWTVTKPNGKKVKVWAFSAQEAKTLVQQGKTKPEGIKLVGRPYDLKKKQGLFGRWIESVDMPQ